MIGTELGPYSIQSELGSGGMGAVYLATDAGGKQLAIKVVHPHLMRSAGFFKRFMREAEIGKRVDHENVVRTLDVDALDVGGQTAHFLVMEYVEGQTLRSLLGELRCVPEELCLHLAREIVKGLEAIHAAGVVHRDLKPENVLVTPDHAVKVMDLGVARLVDESLRLSKSGDFLGSIMYAAPEQWEATDDADGRIDLYALGIMLYELATGKHPCKPGAPHLEVRAIAELNPQLSPFFEQVVETLMAREREDRFASAAVVGRILEEGEESDWWRGRATEIRKATRRPLRRPRLPRETALYGRDAELERMSDAWRATKEGVGQVRLLTGEAGIGKTRLVDEFVARLQRGGEEMHFLFGSYPPSGAATATGAFSTAYREHFGAEELEERLTRCLENTPLLTRAFAALLRGTPAPGGAEPLTKVSLQTAFLETTRALAAERPTVVLIDDLHFAPAEGLALFAALALALAEHRVLLIGTALDDVPEGLTGLEREDHVDRLHLERLGPKELTELLADAFGSQTAASKLGWRIAEKSDGNPFFAFEIIRDLRESGLLAKEDDGSWVTTGFVRKIAIPSSLVDLIQDRLSHLEDDERELLELAACWGHEFDPSLSAAASGEPLLPTLKRFARLEQKHGVIRSDGRNYVFDHHQIRETLYENTFAQLREQYHLALGQALEARGEAERMPHKACEQFLLSSEPRRSEPYLDAALEHFTTGHVMGSAYEMMQRALDIDGLLSGARRAAFLLVASGWLYRIGRGDEERVYVDKAAAIAEELGDVALKSRAVRAQGRVEYRAGKYELATELYQHALVLAREAGNRKHEEHALSALGNVSYRMGNYEAGLEYHRGDLEIARERGNKPAELVALGNIGSGHEYLGRQEEALAYMTESLEITRELDLAWREAQLLGMCGYVLRDLGRYGEAMRHYQLEEDISARVGERRSVLLSSYNHANCLAELGEYEAARVRLEQCLRGVRDMDDAYLEAYIVDLRGKVAAHTGDREAARRHLEEALAARREQGFDAGIAQTLTALGEVDLEEGRESDAVARIDEALAIVRKIASPTHLVLISALRAMLPGGDAPAAVALMAEHGPRVDHRERTKARFLLWKATQDRAHLAEARRLLDLIRENAPEQYRDSMLRNVVLFGDIMEAS